MPPPSCTGGESPSACRIARMTLSFFGLPAAAPFRSTRCSRRAPSAFQCLATTAGSSEYTVASLIFPCFRRTQRPSLMSIAGMISIELEKNAEPRDGRWEDSGIPVEEVGEQPQARNIAFFRVELYRKNIIPCHRAGKGEAVVGGTPYQRGLPRLRKVAVDEIEPAAVLDARPQGVRCGLFHAVPADVRNLELVSFSVDHGLGGKTTHSPREERESGHTAFVTAFEEHLKADADSQKRPAAGGVEDRRTQSTRVHLAHAIGHRALARKYDAVGARHARRIGSHLDPRVRRDMFHRFGNRVEIPHAVINDRDAHCRIGKEPRACPSWRGRCLRRADTAPAPCAGPARTP